MDLLLNVYLILMGILSIFSMLGITIWIFAQASIKSTQFTYSRRLIQKDLGVKNNNDKRNQ